MLIELEEVNKIYNQGKPNEVWALRDATLHIRENSMTCLKGASGSGKSTLLAIIGCVFPPTRGKAAIAGKQLARLPDRFLTRHRRSTIGFIFQQFNILPDLTVLDNIALPLMPLGIPPQTRKEKAETLLETFGMGHRKNFLANQISGGELQRVAIARALINDQPILLADEPTAHLDTKLSMEFMEIMSELKKKGKTIIIASHDPLITENPDLDEIVDIKDGRIHVS